MYTRLNELLFFLAGIGVIYAAFDYLRRRNLKRTLPVLVPFLIAALLWSNMRTVGRAWPTADLLIFNNPRGIVLDAVLVLGAWGYVLYRNLAAKPARPGPAQRKAAKN